MPTPRLKLKQLKEATNAVLRDSLRLRHTTLKDEAVNWGDLFCASAEWRVDDEGRGYYAVQVEEASPDASVFARYVSEKLAEKGFAHVTVDTEW
jgi:hypothetical protein